MNETFKKILGMETTPENPTPSAAAYTTSPANQTAVAAGNDVLLKATQGRKNKPGRPRKEVLPNAGAPQPAPNQQNPPPPAWVLPPAVFEKMVGQGVKAIDEWSAKKIYLSALRVGIAKEDASMIAAEVKLEEEQRALICTLSGAVFLKYQEYLTYAPEAGLVVIALGQFYRVNSAMAKIEEIAIATGGGIKKKETAPVDLKIVPPTEPPK